MKAARAKQAFSLRGWFFRQSILTKILLALIGVILTAFLVNIYINHEIANVLSRMDSVYESNEQIAHIQTNLSKVQDNLYDYLNGNYDSLKNYYDAKESLSREIGDLNQAILGQGTKILEKDIRNMCWTYLYFADRAVQGHRGTNLESYTENYEKAEKIYQYLGSSLFELNSENFAENTGKYEILTNVQYFTQQIGVSILFMMGMIQILVGIAVSLQVVHPLKMLAERTELVGGGEFGLPPLEIRSMDEIGQVTAAFNSMTVRLEESIRQGREQLMEENRLKEQKMALETHLKETQLGALQAQINPHFLYNTLNAGEQLALMEDAEQTCLFLEHVADYYRYNIRRSGKDVLLKEEIEQVENYLFIMNTRFGGEIRLVRNLPKVYPSVRLPGMILQPIMENAIEHGLKNLETEKELAISLWIEEKRIVVAVSDNGPGFPPDKARELLDPHMEVQVEPGAKHGIGMKNVIRRLRLYFDREDVLEIDSRADGSGCEIRILIPYEEELYV